MNAKELGAQAVSAGQPLGGAAGMPIGAYEYGLTKREMFAAMAMSAWIESLGRRHAETGYSDESANAYAAKYGADAADALLAELAKDQP